MTINNTNPEIFYGDGNGGAANQVETGQSSERTHPWESNLCEFVDQGCIGIKDAERFYRHCSQGKNACDRCGYVIGI